MVSVAAVCGWMSAVINREVVEGLCVFVRLFFGGGGGGGGVHYYKIITTDYLKVKGALRGVQRRR